MNDQILTDFVQFCVQSARKAFMLRQNLHLKLKELVVNNTTQNLDILKHAIQLFNNRLKVPIDFLEKEFVLDKSFKKKAIRYFEYCEKCCRKFEDIIDTIDLQHKNIINYILDKQGRIKLVLIKSINFFKNCFFNIIRVKSFDVSKIII